MTLIFIMTPEVTAQGSRHQRYVRGHVLFFDFPTDFPPFLSLSLSLLICLFIGHLSHIFCFGLAYSLRQAGFLKQDKVKIDFRNSIFQVFFSAFKSFWCPASMCFRTDITRIQDHGTGAYTEINIDRIRE